MASILIVDDSKFMRKILSDILVESGHTIIGEAENAREAVELCGRLSPDVVTLDVVMPEVDGVNALACLKTIANSSPRTKVVMVSSMSQAYVVKECFEAGAKDFIAKPFQASQIVDVVTKIAESH